MCPLWSIKKTQEPVEDYSVEFGFKVTSAFFFNLEHPPSLKKIINFFFFFFASTLPFWKKLGQLSCRMGAS